MAKRVGNPDDNLLFGTSGPDVINGLAGHDLIYGEGGNDTIYGGPGSDTVFAVDGSSVIYGHEGDDYLVGQGGPNTFYGGGGNDLIVLSITPDSANGYANGGAGDDIFGLTSAQDATLVGGSGIDTAVIGWFAGSLGAVDIDMTNPGLGQATSTTGGTVTMINVERLVLAAGEGNDSVLAGEQGDLIDVAEGDNLVNAGGGNDVVRYVLGGSSTLDGGFGNDTLIGTTYGDLLNFTVNTVTGSADDSYGSVITGFEAYVLDGGFGDDIVQTGGGRDEIYLYGGANQADAGAGSDLVSYQIGMANTLEGGAGNDLLVVTNGGSALYFIADYTTGAVDDGYLSSLTGFESFEVYSGNTNDIAALWDGRDSFYGGGGNDTVSGRGGADWLEGGLGNDQLMGDAGGDSLYGGANQDYLDGGTGGDFLWGGAGNDTLIGGEGNDRLEGQWGNDSLDGGAGNDQLVFGLGNDTATGGAGADRFVFRANEIGNHLITDFETGVDRLEFSTVLLQFGPGAGALNPALLNEGAAVGAAAQFVYSYDAGTNTTTLVWDPNGDDPAGGVYAMARFTGDIDLAASDFLIV